MKESIKEQYRKMGLSKKAIELLDFRQGLIKKINQTKEQSMKDYTVHCYVTVRVANQNIKASSQQEALKIASENDFSSFIDRENLNLPAKEGFVSEVIFAEEISGYLVDEEGDGSYENSKMYDENFQPEEPFNPTIEAIKNQLRSQTYHYAACQECGKETEDFHCFEGESAAKELIASGWRTYRGHLVCRDCVKKLISSNNPS